MKPVLIVASPYYADIHAMLLAGAEHALKEAGQPYEIALVPGALEIPAAIAIAHRSNHFAGYVALGCVIRGETYHFEIVANESARGLTDIAVREAVPIGNGILTTENEEQARVRADFAQGNKGGEAAKAVLALIAHKTKRGARP